jgi:hypothetical protein
LANASNDILQMQAAASTASAADRLQIDRVLFSAGNHLILDGLSDLMSLGGAAGLNVAQEGIATAEHAFLDWAQTEFSSVVSATASALAPAGWNVAASKAS